MKKIIKTLVIMVALLSCLSVEVYAKTYTYDALNRVTQVINDNGVTQTYTYDKAGNTLTCTSNNNSTIERLQVTTLPTKTKYTVGGRLSEKHILEIQ